jgi:flagellar motor component MotA
MSLPHLSAAKVVAWVVAISGTLHAAVFIKDSGVNVALIVASSSLLTLIAGLFMFYMTHKWKEEAKVAVDEVKKLAVNINVNVDGKLDQAIKAMAELARAQGRREGSEAERDMGRDAENPESKS